MIFHKMKNVYLFGLVLSIVKLNKCFPHNSTIISKYAKVAVWGTNKTDHLPRQEYRNHRNGNIWNHRLDPKNITQPSKKKNPSVAYQYPVYLRPEARTDKQVEHVPGIGEVIVNEAQDRFEARPLFAYKNRSPYGTYGPPKSSPTSASASVASPASTPPVATPLPSLIAPQGGGIYNSPFSSYNPPEFKPDSSGTSDFYPPNISLNIDSSSISSEEKAPAMEAQVVVSTEAPKMNTPDSYSSLGPPLATFGDYDEDQSHDSHPEYQPQSVHDQASPEDPMAVYKYQDERPQHPPKSIDDVYYPPDFPKDEIPNHQVSGNGNNILGYHHSPPMMPPVDHGMMPAEDQRMMPPEDMMESEKLNGGHDDHVYAASPPPHYEQGHAFPQYLYDNHHYDHHVYEEIPHTTMPPAKEDKRVSSTHYSYYYLGRKLWYIPLYFSVYFIIYVTVLILKSIARHKVRIKYKWYEHDTSAKQARSMNLDNFRNEELSNVHENVTTALKNAAEKYNNVIAM